MCESPPLTGTLGWGEQEQERVSEKGTELNSINSEKHSSPSQTQPSLRPCLPRGVASRVQRLSRRAFIHMGLLSSLPAVWAPSSEELKMLRQKAQGRVLRGSILLWQGVAEGGKRISMNNLLTPKQDSFGTATKSGGISAFTLRSHLRYVH